MNAPTQAQLLGIVFHQLLSRRDPESYLRTTMYGSNEGYVAGMMYAVAIVRHQLSQEARSTGRPTRVCTCCLIARPTDEFRQRIDRRYAGRTLTVAACQDCERSYCTTNSKRRSAVKLDRVMRIREDKRRAEDPEYAAEADRTQKVIASRFAHVFMCRCEECKL